MKRVLFATMLLFANIGMAQNITVTFTGKNSSDNRYRQLTEVRVENATQGWSQTLTYPDTTLILNMRQGIYDVENEEEGLWACSPNPFAGHTTSFLTLHEAVHVTIEAIRVTGQQLAEWTGELAAGNHKIDVTISETQVAFLCVHTAHHRWVTKMVNKGSGGSNKIEVGECFERNPFVASKAVAEGEFQPGDEMHYTGICQDALAAPVTRLQNADELIVFEFTDIMPPLDLPTVTTSTVDAITSSTAACGGDVTADGNAPVTARGVCWSESNNPTIADQHTSDGSGTGSFTSNITWLTDNTTYYVRAYATNSQGTAYGEERSFTTAEAPGPELPTVTTTWIESVTAETATCGGQVTSEGSAAVTAKGVCWSTNPSPTVGDSHTNDGTGLGTFNSTITGLTYSTRYYVRAYATNEVGTAYGAERTFATGSAPELPTVTTSFVTMWTANICEAGGTVTSDGNSEVTDRGVCWSRTHNPTISDSHNSAGSGTGQFLSVITGLASGEIYFLRAYATNSVGTAYGEERVFITIAPGGAFDDVGATEAFFSVDSNRMVRFSKGNLQYQASTGLWRFAEHQYDYVGDGNANISETYDGWIDLFGWGTSGWNSGAVCYQPWSTLGTLYDYCPGGYGATGNELTGDYANADWGVYNAISNGGNRAGMWKTMTYSEFKYLLFDRDEPFRFAKATVNGIRGLIIFPDNFMRPGTIVIDASSLNVVGSNFTQNIYDEGQWEELENSGCVFLPAAGERWSSSSVQLNGVGQTGHYWTSSRKQSPYYVWGLSFYASDYTQGMGFGDGNRNTGTSVRLVREVSLPEVITAEVDNISTVTAQCGGTVTNDGGGCYIVRGVCWSTSENPTIADSHTLDGIGVGSFASVMTELEIGTTYHVRAYAMYDNIGIAYGEDRTFTTRESLALPTVEIETIDYTMVDGADVNCIVTDNGGANITARGVCWSLDAEPTVADAHTTDQPCMGQYRSIITSLENTSTYHVRAYATNSVGTAYSRDTTITTTYANRDAFDHYGASIAVFSVSDTLSVRFSKGNLQYTNEGTHTVATGDTMPGTWRFANYQYNNVGEDNANISDSYDGWIDLFGWGTSGWNSGAVKYMPYDTSSVSGDFRPGADPASDLTGDYAFADWGVFNAIKYSGNMPEQWRTMTRYEWTYMLNTRNASTVGDKTNARYAIANVNGFIGVLIFPDVFTMPTGVATPVNINKSIGAFGSANTYSAEDWRQLESAGAVFIPAAGERSGSQITCVDSNGVPWAGRYWTSTHSGTGSACIVDFMDSYLHGISSYGRNNGVSVRLVKNSGLPTVTTDTVSDVTNNSFTCGGTVTSSGNSAVTERGLCWDTIPNPSIAGRHTSYVSGAEHFTTGIAGLTRRTTYYVRAYATNSAGTAYGQERVFTTAPDPSELAVVTTAEVNNITVTGATCGGSVVAEGMAEVTARGTCWSTSHNPTVANQHTTDSAGLGDFTSTISGLHPATTYYVRAYATNAAATSYGEEYEFRTLDYTSPAFDADGASIALFSVSDTSSVHFSKGNLQYSNEGTHLVATGETIAGTWRFADYQYDYVGDSNANISSSYSGWIDLFCWGTSGWNSGAVEYMPYSTSEGLYDYQPGGAGENDLAGDYAFADWGVYNAISNGGNTPEMWRTLTFDEWCYLLFGRAGSQLNGNDSARYVKAQVAGVPGLIIFPDNYSHPDNVALPTNINSTTAGYISNIYSSEAWMAMEEAGAIFLPSAGSRSGQSVYPAAYQQGVYTTATHGPHANDVKGFQFASTYFITGNFHRKGGLSVRLVKNHVATNQLP